MLAARLQPNSAAVAAMGLAALGLLAAVLSAALSARCPPGCRCPALQASCRTLPRYLPPDTRRLNLEGKNITRLDAGDLQNLHQLRILLLSHNLISELPPNFLDSLPNLHRLDLSHNRISRIPKKISSAKNPLKILQLEHNEIRCVEEGAFRDLTSLETLTLHNNNLTALRREVFSSLDKLQTLKVSDNPFRCDCTLAWLGSWLRGQGDGGPHCALPYYVRGKSLADLPDSEFRCNGLEERTACPAESLCPFPCSCHDSVVDCREKGLKELPSGIPNSTTELRLEQNQIKELPPRAFSGIPRLRRLDLSNNLISNVAPDAFRGLHTLTSLVLYGNRITDLPEGVFKGLTSLQLLLLNANKISCIRKDTFSELHHLNLLSLYDNSIQSIANGTFESLFNLQTLHLARNPFICDCNLRWLAVYLSDNPVETSGALCASPRRVHRRKLAQLPASKFKCKGSERFRTRRSGECFIDRECPEACVCEGTIVDCSRRHLSEIPSGLPSYTVDLRLNDNRITKIKNNGLFKKLPELEKLDLRGNSIVDIEDGALTGAVSLTDLLLTDNRLKDVRPKMFAGLARLKTLMLRNNHLTYVSNDSFTDLNSLQILSLNDNKIRCVAAGAFNNLPSLTTLNVVSNPLACNCHARGFSSWLQRTTVVTGNPRCHAPSTLKDVPLQDVEPTDLVCDDEAERQQVCGPESECPPKCFCSATSVHCSRQKLRAIPRHIQVSITELYLDVNEISEVSPYLNALVDLQRLDLSNNQISILPNNSFKNLTNLSTLILSYNKLQCLQVDSFNGLRALRILSLHGNDLSMIPDGSFKDLISISHIALGANPLLCDCHLRWLAERIKKDFVEPGIARCAEPHTMRDRLLLSASASSFICTKPPETYILAKCDACYTFPCLNGASCESILHNRTFRCHCQPGFHGSRCQYAIDACYGGPCENGGICKVLEAGRFSCHCSAGFEGERCQMDIDECRAHKCQHNATCRDRVNGYSCECGPGYTGQYCEKKIEFCSKEFNPCKNGATCLSHGTHYSCACGPGHTGQNCTQDVDVCADHECQNGGTCLGSSGGHYECECLPGFGGSRCELVPEVSHLYPQTSPCQHHDCLHGDCFQPAGSADYVCRCHPGFSGPRCEAPASVTLRAGSYLEFAGPDFAEEVNVTLSFSTLVNHGVLLYTGGERHLAAELYRGRVRVSLDVGNPPPSTMFSFEEVADGLLHVVQLVLAGKNFTLRVDQGPARTIINDGNQLYLNNPGPLFIGGITPEKASLAVRHWQLWNVSSLIGCLSEVVLNGVPLDPQRASHRQKVTPGCSDRGAAPCANHLCQRGRCVELGWRQDYECRCDQGWSGPFCDQAPTCQREHYRDYHTESNGCKSLRKVKLTRCVGSCGTQCCRAAKTKKRHVRMGCPDGRIYQSHIELVRKCRCVDTC